MISYTHLHAMLVHFPVALLLVGFLSDLVGLLSTRLFFRQTATYLLVLGTAGVLAAFFSGQAAGDGVEGGSLGVALGLHKQAALFTLWSSLSGVLLRLAIQWRRQKHYLLRITAFVLFASSAIAVSYTGYLGGQLVFKHAAGVKIGL